MPLREPKPSPCQTGVIPFHIGLCKPKDVTGINPYQCRKHHLCSSELRADCVTRATSQEPLLGSE